MSRSPRRSAILAVLLALASIAPAGAQLEAATNDPVYTQGLQWGLDTIGAPVAWTVARGAGTTIAIVDSGIDLTHEDLAAKVTGNVSCIGTAGDAAKCAGSGQDDNGHGTHVAGIAAAVTGNGRGMAGVAPDAELLAVRVLADDAPGEAKGTASGTAGDVAAGIRWAADHGADVINLSLGGGSEIGMILTGCAFCDAISYAWEKGAIAVIAAGNDSVLPSGFGDEPAVIVTATTRSDDRASYSNATSGILRAARWAVAAPGGEGETDPADCATGGRPQGIVSTYWIDAQHSNEYACLAGTSMAAPFVSGALALLRGQGLSPSQAVAQLLATARDLGPSGRDSSFGDGRIDLASAVGPARPQPPTTTSAPAVTAAVVTTIPSTTAPPSAPTSSVPAPAVVVPTVPPTELAIDIGEGSEAGEESRPGEGIVALALAMLMAAAAATVSGALKLRKAETPDG